MRRICVFCGSHPGIRPTYLSAAIELGELLVKEKIGLVYGGANIGLMGAVANAALKGQGEIIGVIPQNLFKKEVAHEGLADLRIVTSMHERKATMAELSDGFIALPGGIGTFEEVCEILTWSQLGLHSKPIGLLNIDGYFDPFIQMLDRSVSEGFMRPQNRARLLVAHSPSELLDQFRIERKV